MNLKSIIGSKNHKLLMMNFRLHNDIQMVRINRLRLSKYMSEANMIQWRGIFVIKTKTDDTIVLQSQPVMSNERRIFHILTTAEDGYIRFSERVMTASEIKKMRIKDIFISNGNISTVWLIKERKEHKSNSHHIHQFMKVYNGKSLMKMKPLFNTLIKERREELRNEAVNLLDNEIHSLSAQPTYSYISSSIFDNLDNQNECTYFLNNDMDFLVDRIHYNIIYDKFYQDLGGFGNIFFHQLITHILRGMGEYPQNKEYHTINFTLDIRIPHYTLLDNLLNNGKSIHWIINEFRNRLIRYFKNFLGVAKDTYVTNRSSSFKFQLQEN